MNAYIFDIDGTVADASHRLHHIQKDPPDWAAFYAEVDKDAPIEPVIRIARALKDTGAEIVFITGRSDETRRKTADWLIANGFWGDIVLMRRQGDHREDHIVKEEILNWFYNTYPDLEIQAVFEDRASVVKMYRARGLRVLQVAPGDF